jgi:hypothetical protein
VVELKPRDLLVVVGKTGTGKGRWAKAQLALWMSCFAIVWFDPLDEYSTQGEETPECGLGPLTQRCTVSELLADPARWLSADPLALAVVPDSSDPESVAADYEDVAVQVKHEAKRRGGRMLFGSDEVGHFEEFARPKLKEVGTTFRHWGVARVYIAQRAVFIPLAVRSQASHLISFRQDEDADIDALYRRTRRTDELFAERVSRLPLGKFEHWRDTQERKEA